MCDKCDLIDYPVADCWRPCSVPPRRQAAPPRPDLGEDHYKAQDIIWALRKQLRDSEQRNRVLVAEVELLKARAPKVVNGPAVPTMLSVATIDG